MITLEIQEKKYLGKTIAENFVEDIKVSLVIKPLQKICNKDFYDKKLEQMRVLPTKTIGNDIARMLDTNGLRLIPKYVNHDLKHLLLGYGMTTEEEIKMQAYLFGNGNYSFSCILFLLSGILFPSLWNKFYKEYRKGKKAPSILELSIDDCMEEDTNEVRNRYRG